MESELVYIRRLLEEIKDTMTVAFQNHTEETIMSAKDLADFLKMDISLIYSKSAKGEIPHIKLGKLYKFKKSEILEWIKRQEKSSVFSVDDYVERYLQTNSLRG